MKNDPPTWLSNKWVVLTIKDANGTDTRPQYRAHAAMPVQRLKHELSVLPASPFVDGDELRVVSSSPMQSRPLDSMEERRSGGRLLTAYLSRPGSSGSSGSPQAKQSSFCT